MQNINVLFVEHHMKIENTRADVLKRGHVITGDVADWISQQVLDGGGKMADMLHRK